MDSLILLTNLRTEVQNQTTELEKNILQLDEKTLNREPVAGKWSALQCIAHLNSYAAHYLPAFEKAMRTSLERDRTFEKTHRPTWLGRKSIQTVVATNTRKIKTPARHNHKNKMFEKKALYDFLQYQQRLSGILTEAEKVSLNRTKTAIEIMPLLKLNLGDFLQFFISHQTRHIQQAIRAANANYA